MGQEPYVEEYTIQAGFYRYRRSLHEIRATLKMLGIPSEVVRRAAVVAYEAEMNAMIHAVAGLSE